MNVTFLSCAHLNCGIGRYSEELSKALVEKGVSVSGFRKQESNERFTAYPYRSFKELRHYIAPYYLNKAIKQVQSEILQADYVDAALSVNEKMLRKNNSTLFTTVHDAIPFLFPTSKTAFSMYKWQLKHAANLSEKLIVVSYQSKKDLIEHGGILPEKIEVVYNGINHEFFYPNETKKENDVFTIRYVGGLGGYKNVSTLIDMAAILQDWNLDVRIEIAGSHPEASGLPQLAESKNIHNVFFPGFIPDSQLRSFLADADLFVFPSLYEGFGFPPLEAMASGTAVVSSDKGSLGEVLSYGAITTNPDAYSLAEAVRDVYFNPSLKQKLEIHGHALASQFTWEKSANAMLSLYQSKKTQNSNVII